MALITYRPNKPKKDEWPEWRKFCQDIYDDLEDEKHFSKIRNRDTRHQPQTTQPAASPAPTTNTQALAPAAASDPMQLDSAGAVARREYRRLNNLCFYCGGMHTVRDCEEKKQNDAKFSRPTNTAPGTPRGRGGTRGGFGRASYNQPSQHTPYPTNQPSQQFPLYPPQPQYLTQSGQWPPQYHTPRPQHTPANRIRALEPGYDTESVTSRKSTPTPRTETDSYTNCEPENE